MISDADLDQLIDRKRGLKTEAEGCGVGIGTSSGTSSEKFERRGVGDVGAETGQGSERDGLVMLSASDSVTSDMDNGYD